MRMLAKVSVQIRKIKKMEKMRSCKKSGYKMRKVKKKGGEGVKSRK